MKKVTFLYHCYKTLRWRFASLAQGTKHMQAPDQQETGFALSDGNGQGLAFQGSLLRGKYPHDITAGAHRQRDWVLARATLTRGASEPTRPHCRFVQAQRDKTIGAGV